MAVVSMSHLLEAGVHFGHQTRRWNPKMKEYIFTAREDIYIIDLQKTQKLIELAYNEINTIAKDGGKVLFIGTKKQAQTATVEEATRAGMFYVTERWLGGTLTNFKTIRKRIKRLENIEKMEIDGTFDRIPKKEVIQIKKEYEKLNKNLCGIRDMDKLPNAIFIVDPKKEEIAIKEARKLKIPVFGIVDTNCDPDDVDFVIPGNDDAIRSVKLVLGVMVNAIVEANGGKIIDYSTEEERKPRPQGQEYNNDRNRPRRDEYPRRDFRPNNTQTAPVAKVAQAPVAVAPVEVAKEVVIEKKAPKKEEKVIEVVKEAIKKVSVKKTAKAEEKVKPVKEKAKKEIEKPVKKVKAEVKTDISTLNLTELKALAKEKGITGYSKMKKEEILSALK